MWLKRGYRTTVYSDTHPDRVSVQSGTIVLFVAVGATSLWSCWAVYTPFTHPFEVAGVQRNLIYIEEAIEATIVHSDHIQYLQHMLSECQCMKVREQRVAAFC